MDWPRGGRQDADNLSHGIIVRGKEKHSLIEMVSGAGPLLLQWRVRIRTPETRVTFSPRWDATRMAVRGEVQQKRLQEITGIF